MVESLNKGSQASFSCRINQIMPSISSPTDNMYLSQFRKATGNQEYLGLNYGTDAAVLVSNSPKPLPFVIFGPGNPKQIHVSNERVKLDELYKAERIFIEFLEQTVIRN